MTATRTARRPASAEPGRPSLLTVAELADLLRISIDTVYSWAAEGKLPKPIRIGRRLLWRAEDIDDLLR
jgi:excisionase family DNA binding protein